MADRKITDLTALAAGSQATGDLLTIVDVSESAAADKNKKITVENLFKGIPSSVGIGTSSPSNTLHISGAGTIARLQSSTSTAALRFHNSADDDGYIKYVSQDLTFTTADNERARFDSSGRLLVGRTSALNVGAGSAATTEIQNSSGFNLSLISTLNSSGAGGLAIGKARGGSVVQSGDDLGSIVFAGHDGSDFETRGASITAQVDGSPGSNDMTGRLMFSTTADAASSVTERVRIDSSGRVGIGATSPGRRVVVTGDTNTVVAIEGATNGTSSLFLGDSDDEDVCSLTYNNSTNALSVNVNASERIRVDSSGRLLINHSSSIDTAGVQSQLQVTGDNAAKASIGIRRDQNVASGPLLVFGKSRSGGLGGNVAVQSGDTIGAILFNGADGTDVATSAARIKTEVDGTPGSNDMPGRLVFETTADGANSLTERMRIINSGAMLVSTTSATINSSNFGTRIGGASTTAGYIASSRNVGTGGEVANFFGQSGELRIKGDGDCENTNNRYSGLSDIKLKENIVDANSQWDDIKSLQIRNYNYKEETGYGTHTQLGLVAQEVETICPGLVTETNDVDDDLNETGTVTKSVAYSVLYMKAVKALQEAIAKIETLEAKVAALEAQ